MDQFKTGIKGVCHWGKGDLKFERLLGGEQGIALLPGP